MAAAAEPRGAREALDARRASSNCFRGSASAQDRMGNQLSGGEQQMLAVGRALMTNPRLLILDEATEGLAPLIRRRSGAASTQLKARGSRS